MFFVDAAHFVFGAFLSALWCFTRVWIKAPCGRQRFNVLGAINAVTKEVITITNTGYINSTSVCALLNRIKALDLAVPITLVLDNARYQRCALVQNLADTLKIELLFLPPIRQPEFDRATLEVRQKTVPIREVLPLFRCLYRLDTDLPVSNPNHPFRGTPIPLDTQFSNLRNM